MTANNPLGFKKNVYQSDSHPKFNHLYELLKATCPPGYMEQEAQILNLKKIKLQLDPQIDEILPGLFLGNQDAALDQQTIKKYNIKAICSCGHYLGNPISDIDYKRFIIGDFEQQNIRQYFDEFIEWVEDKLQNGKNNPEKNQRGNVLVHCTAGISRSASLIIAYLIGRKGMTYEEAYSFVKERRNVIQPNEGFKNQLKQYEEEKLSDNEG